MALLTLTTTLSDPADKTEVEGNASTVQTWANGNIDNDNIASSAGIAISKLATITESCMITFPDLAVFAGTVNDVLLGPLPVPAGTWTADSVGYSFAYDDAPTTTDPSISIYSGYITTTAAVPATPVASEMTAVTTQVNAQALPATYGTLTTSAVSVTNGQGLYVVLDVKAAGTIAAGLASVTVRLTRTVS